MQRTPRTVLVTGGAGFIGANFLYYLFDVVHYDGRVINLDALTYAANPRNLDALVRAHGDRYLFVHDDICNQQGVKQLIDSQQVDCIVHFAAESHVDRSIDGPHAFVRTNINGTLSLLEAARASWGSRQDVLFHHVSTDEVYGSLDGHGEFYETTPYAPRSPYSASKAAADHLVRAYSNTYGLPVTISNCSNNYGPYQFPEKLIPLMICNMLEQRPLPVYGDGKNVRDWLYVTDHASAVWAIITGAHPGATYNIGGGNQWTNIDLVRTLCTKVATKLGRQPADYEHLITFVADRPGHDLRYAINCDKIRRELGWQQTVDFDQGLERTVDWYLDASSSPLPISSAPGSEPTS